MNFPVDEFIFSYGGIRTPSVPVSQKISRHAHMG